MNIISPLTLLVIPIIGSLVILSFPHLTSSIAPVLNTKSEVMVAEGMIRPGQSGERSVSVNTGALNELKQIPTTDKNNSSLKKIAILTSLVNFIISIIL